MMNEYLGFRIFDSLCCKRAAGSTGAAASGLACRTVCLSLDCGLNSPEYDTVHDGEFG